MPNRCTNARHAGALTPRPDMDSGELSLMRSLGFSEERIASLAPYHDCSVCHSTVRVWPQRCAFACRACGAVRWELYPRGGAPRFLLEECVSDECRDHQLSEFIRLAAPEEKAA